MKLSPVLLLSAALLVFNPSPVPAGESSLPRKVEAFNLELGGIARLPDRDRATRVRAMYHGYFRHVIPADLDDSGLQSFFRVTLNAASLGYDSGIAARARVVFDELRARSLQAGSDYQYMQGLYVRLRMLDEATGFHAAHRHEAGLESLPAIEGGRSPAGQPWVLALVGGTDRLQRRGVDLSRERTVLVVAHPLCDFSVQAADAIAGDRELRAFFLAHSTWVVPPDFRFHLAEVRNWNQHRSAFELALVDDVDDWPDVATWDTPTFYFFERGRLVATVEGWPKGGRKPALLEAIRKAQDSEPRRGAGLAAASAR